MFTDEDQAAKLVRDPVAPAKRSDAAMKKVLSRTLEDGSTLRTYIGGGTVPPPGLIRLAQSTRSAF